MMYKLVKWMVSKIEVFLKPIPDHVVLYMQPYDLREIMYHKCKLSVEQVDELLDVLQHRGKVDLVQRMTIKNHLLQLGVMTVGGVDRHDEYVPPVLHGPEEKIWNDGKLLFR